MPLDPETVRAALLARAAADGSPPRCIVAYSGGRDSTLLLYLMAQFAPALGCELLAAHVNHGLQSAAEDWQLHCERQAAALNVNFVALRLDDARQGRSGPEGNARAARYRALESLLQDGDWLLTGHHQDDQAETVLLNLMRGSGVAGVRGIAACRPFARGSLLRPLLACSAAEVAEAATRYGLSWIDDPSNQNTDFDRNFLRRRVMPLLISRWPAASRQLARSAALASEAAGLLDEVAAADLRSCGSAQRLSTVALAALPVVRCSNVLRHACQELALPAPPARQLDAIVDSVLPARVDATPLVSWPGAEARRYREQLYLLPTLPAAPLATAGLLKPDTALPLDAGLGELRLEPSPAGGIARDMAAAGLQLRFRQGGEVLRPAGRGTGKPLKKLLQEAGVVPWMRGRLPLLYKMDKLVAVADLWIAEGFFAADGLAVVWRKKPAIM